MTALSVVISIVVGAIYASMGGTQIMLTITCSLPVIERLHQENAINYQEARSISRKVIILWSIVSVILIICAFIFLDWKMALGFLIGFSISMLLISRKRGINEKNMRDFLKIYRPYVRISTEQVFKIFKIKKQKK